MDIIVIPIHKAVRNVTYFVLSLLYLKLVPHKYNISLKIPKHNKYNIIVKVVDYK